MQNLGKFPQFDKTFLFGDINLLWSMKLFFAFTFE